MKERYINESGLNVVKKISSLEYILKIVSHPN
jgi:hypothetical protein